MSAQKIIVLFFVFWSFTFSAAFASAADSKPFFSYQLVKDKSEPRGLFWRPALSLFLPGFDQWAEGQYRAAAVYSGYALAGILTARSANPDKIGVDPDGPLNSDERKWAWGNQAYLDAGFVSSYHSFRKVAETRKSEGEFLFLKHEDTTGDLLLAPFHVQYLLRPTTFIPLVLIAGLAAADTRTLPHHFEWRGDDVMFGSTLAYGAGVSEEAFFRGEMMPILYEGWGNRFWSNTVTATIFAAAHYSSTNTLPWPQFMVGWYLGWLTQRNEWELSQSVFVHAWWDVIALGESLAYSRGQRIYVPLVDLRF